VTQLYFPDPAACAPHLSSAHSLAPPLLVLLRPFVKVSFFSPQEETCSSLLVLIPLFIFLLLLLPPSSVPWSCCFLSQLQIELGGEKTKLVCGSS
jgi:hypothetical protein